MDRPEASPPMYWSISQKSLIQLWEQSSWRSPTADLFVLDVMLPDGNGVELCETTKGDRDLSSIPVLMMSAHAGFAVIKRSCSADDFIPKPFDIDDLSARVKQLMVKA